MVKLIYGRAYPEGLPKTAMEKITNLEKVYTEAAKTPKELIMKPSESKLIYDSGEIWKSQQKFYEKVLPKSYLKNKFYEYTKMPKGFLEGKFSNKKPYDPIARLIKSLPDVKPSISPNLRSPSISFSSFMNLFKNSSSTGLKSSSVKIPSSGGSSSNFFSSGSPSRGSSSKGSSSGGSSSGKSSSSSSTSPPPPYLLPSSLYGRGARGSEFSLFEEKYRFRGVNKFDPMKELNKMKVNIKGLNAMKTKVKT
jgi:hypothetical protein